MRDEHDDLAERLMDLLGRAEDDPVVQNFLSDFREYLEVQTMGRLRMFQFLQLGFTIDHDARAGFIFVLSFHMNTASTKEGSVVAYSHTLPYGIKPSHTRAEISSILGKPSESEYNEGNHPCEDGPTWWDTYEIPPLSIGLIFSSEGAVLDLFSVHYSIKDKLGLTAHKTGYELNPKRGPSGKQRRCSFCRIFDNGKSCFVIECEATGICNCCLDKFATELFYPRTSLEIAENCSFCLPLGVKHLATQVKVIRNGSYTVCEVCAESLAFAMRSMARASNEPPIAEPDIHFPAFGPE